MNPNWISGDGGPAVVLQSAAAAVWDGTQTEGVAETDYDAICAIEEDGIHVLRRHERDMLVLSDCENSSAFVKLPGGEIAILQAFDLQDDPQVFVKTLDRSAPDAAYELQIVDPFLRLLVGADTGDGSVYGYEDCPVAPGRYQVQVYLNRQAYVALLTAT